MPERRNNNTNNNRISQNNRRKLRVDELYLQRIIGDQQTYKKIATTNTHIQAVGRHFNKSGTETDRHYPGHISTCCIARQEQQQQLQQISEEKLQRD